jgi:translocator protein
MNDIARPARGRDGLWLVLAVLPVVAASALGQVATSPHLAPWYASLAMPGFAPPNWLFGPVWTLLYGLMAFAAWRILRLPAAMPGRTAALALFFAQLALNGAWPWMFFAAHSPALGLLDIVPQLLLILLTMDRFRRLDPPSAWCLAPLAAWVSFATLLNFAILRLNG